LVGSFKKKTQTPKTKKGKISNNPLLQHYYFFLQILPHNHRLMNV
jgi:hypothetical protein